MSSEYTSLQITEDAVKFIESQFGQHYLKRLRESRERCLEDAMNITLTDSYRANRASQATAVQKEIDYFTTAQTVNADKTMMQRLRDAARRKEATPSIEL